MTNEQIQSAISSINGKEDSLRVRGYAIEELAEKRQFEDVAFLLLAGELPTPKERTAFCEALRKGLDLNEESRFAVYAFQKDPLPPVGLRSFLSSLGMREELPEHPLLAGAHLMGRMAACTAGFNRVSQGEPPLSPQPSGSFAAQLFFLSFGKPPKQPQEQALDRALSLHSENGLNASTFAVRISASAGADLVSALCAGLATLIGPRHGGAAIQVVEMLQAIGDPNNVKDWIQTALASKTRIPGFGHRIFQGEDPRALFLGKELRTLSRFTGVGNDLAILQTLAQEFRQLRRLPRNIDFYAGPLFSALGFTPGFFPCLFATGRTPGWIAHFQEQVQKGRLIRPRASYVGPQARKLPNGITTETN